MMSILTKVRAVMCCAFHLESMAPQKELNYVYI